MNQELIRNFCIIAHIDHGKSTLADRLLEKTGTVSPRQMKEQLLDQMDLERERGITIKLQPVRMKYGQYILNLIDTPGHVDFSYEVSRSLASVEGAILLVDATSGIQAQTLSTLYQAYAQNLTIIPVVNKIDLPNAETKAVKRELQKLLDCPAEEILLTSGKTGQGVDELLRAIVEKIPPPPGEAARPARLLVFDSKYDYFRGVIAYVRVVDGQVKKGQKIKLFQTGSESDILEVGHFLPAQVESFALNTGEVGYIITNFKDVKDVLVGDTIILSESGSIKAPLPGFQKIAPNVFASVFCVNRDQTPNLRQALEKLQLNDSSLTYEPEKSTVLGLGFRCGFLGLLHLEIIKERLSREFGLEILSTTPSVSYKLTLTDDSEIEINSATDFPESNHIFSSSEPITECEIVSPSSYLGKILQLVNFSRGVVKTTNYLDSDRVIITAQIPLAEVVINFFDRLKSATSGYASASYGKNTYRQTDLARLDILIAGETISPLSQIVPKNQVQEKGNLLVSKLKDLIPPENFAVAIQAQFAGKIIARETISARRKDVTAKLYGGDVTRKMKLLEKQKKGKKKLELMGKVHIPSDVFWQVLKD